MTETNDIIRRRQSKAITQALNALEATSDTDKALLRMIGKAGASKAIRRDFVWAGAAWALGSAGNEIDDYELTEKQTGRLRDILDKKALNPGA